MRKQNKNHTKKVALIVAIVAIAVAAGAYVRYAKSKSPKDLKNVQSAGQNTKGEVSERPADEADSSQKTDTTQQTDAKRDQDASAQPVDIITPSGNFVSSHEVNMDSLVASSCVTTPGITCTIMLANGKDTVSLRPQSTDKEGASYWEWTPKQVGLHSGEWSVKAIATSGANTKSATDALTLKVK